MAMLPDIKQLRASQKKGAFNEGLNETDCKDLNAEQGHKADIREATDAMELCKEIQDGLMDGNESGNMDRLDRTDRADWPDAPKI